MLRQWLIDREITMVHLIDHDILRQTAHRLIVCPSFRVTVAQINNHALFAIDAYRLGKDAWRSLSID